MTRSNVRRLRILIPLLAIATACERGPQEPDVAKPFAAAQGAFDPIPELAYVGIGYQPYVTVLHVPEMREVARIYLPSGEVGTPALAPDGSVAYVPHAEPAGLTKVDLATHAVLSNLQLEENSSPFDIALTPDGRRAFVTQFEGAIVSVIDTREMKLIKEIELTDADDYANGITTGPGGRTVFVASQVSGRVHVIDSRRLEVVKEIVTGMETVNELALTWDGALLLVTASEGHKVIVIDAKTLDVEGAIDLPGCYPVSVAISSRTREAYVTCRASNVVAVIDIASLEVVDDISVTPNPERIAVNNSGKLALTTHRGNGQITLIDIGKREVLATVYGENEGPWNIPWGIAFATGSQRNTGGSRPGVPAHLFVAGGQQQTGIVGRPTFEAFKVYLYDAFYEPIPDAEISWEVTSGGGMLHPDLWPTDGDGRTYAHLRLGESPGENTVTASVPGVDPVTFTAIGEEGTGAFGFIRQSSSTNWYVAYDLGLSGPMVMYEPRYPLLQNINGWYGTAMLLHPWNWATPGRWGLRIGVNNMSPLTEYTVVFARYALDVQGDHDVTEVVGPGWPSEPDKLVLAPGGSAKGYPDNECTTGAEFLPVLADANPFVVGYFKTDADGNAYVRCNLDASGSGLWWEDNSIAYPGDAQKNLAPFIPSSDDLSAGRFSLPSYNYVYIVEGRGTPPEPVPDYAMVMRWQVGIDIDLGGQPIENGYAPFPFWPKYWP